MKFHYKVKKSTGEVVEGVRQADDRFALARQMKDEGFFVVSTKPLGGNEKKISWQKINNIFGRVSLREKIVFASNLSSMISAGLSLIRSLNVMERQTTNRYLKLILQAIGEKVTAGESLSVALAGYRRIFPEVFVAMVSAGEESGNLPNSLKVVSEQMSKSYELRRKIKGAMIYPAVIIVVIIVIAILMMIFLVPTLTDTFKELGVDLPFSTKIIIFISDFLSNNIFTTIVGILGIILFLVWYGRTRSGRQLGHYLLLHLPFLAGITKKVNSAIIMRTISSLVSSGVSMVETLKITERVVQNIYYKKVIKEAIKEVQKGVGLSVVFNSQKRLFPVLVSEMTLVGEETGNLPEMLMNGARFFEEEVDQVTKNLSTIIEPVLMVLIGIAVGFFAISMIGPMYSLSDAI